MTTTTTPTVSVSRKKIELDRLVFTLSWEDPELDRAAFAPLGGGRRVATVASGGCNAITFLLDDPVEVVAFDYNPTQIHVLELKRASFLALRHGEVLELFGVRDATRAHRAELFARASEHLSRPARAFWSRQAWLLARGLLGGGRYERFVRTFRAVLSAIQGRRTIHELFVERDRDARVAFYDQRWDGVTWRLLFRAFFNQRVLASRGLSADYFTFADSSMSFAEAFALRTRRVLTELPVRDNPFMAQYALGRFLDEAHLPPYLDPRNFDVLKARMPRLHARVADVRTFGRDAPTRFDAICLSNVFELMSEEETAATVRAVADLLVDGGRLTIRNLMIPRDARGASDVLVLDDALSRSLHERDRSFVYRSFQAYERAPRGGRA